MTKKISDDQPRVAMPICLKCNENNTRKLLVRTAIGKRDRKWHRQRYVRMVGYYCRSCKIVVITNRIYRRSDTGKGVYIKSEVR